MPAKNSVLWLCTLVACSLIACSRPSDEITVLKKLPVDNLDGIITRSGVEIDEEISTDGNGSLRAATSAPTVVRLYEIEGIDVENARLIYRAKVRTENVEGKVYLEMWCHFQGKGEFFSRGLQSALTGTNEWTTLETPFFLKKGENPNTIKLNLAIEGKGTAWVDDIKLVKGVL